MARLTSLALPLASGGRRKDGKKERKKIKTKGKFNKKVVCISVGWTTNVHIWTGQPKLTVWIKLARMQNVWD